jgi:Superinfection immunity protein
MDEAKRRSREDSSLPMEIAERILLIVGAILYFVPTFIAWRLGVKSVRSIFYVNLIFGWTIVGWVFAVMWVMAERNELPTNHLS